MKKIIIKLQFIFLIIGGVVLFSCENLVEEGIRITYPESDVQLTVTAIPDTFGIPGDTIAFLIKAEDLQNIRSFRVNPRYQGASGTKYSFPNEDPFIDHIFGTIQKNTRSFEIIYKYVIPSGVNQINVEFVLTDELGKKSVTKIIKVITDVITYSNIELHSKNDYQTDGFSTANGIAYRNLKNYEAVTELNRQVQENLDIVFLVTGDNNAKLTAPASTGFSSNMTIKNRTNLMKMDQITKPDFDNLNAGNILHVVPVDSLIKADSYAVQNLKVGDFVAFVTDYNATNSYKAGLLRITSLHRSSCSWYEGTSYLIEFDVKVQIDEALKGGD